MLSGSTVNRSAQAADVARVLPRPDPAGTGYNVAVVISALDEAATIGSVIARVPRRIPKVREVEVIVVDDGSSDATSIVALAAGADHVERHRRNRGLAAAFRSGVNAALATGADIVVHLDADGQHAPELIPSLVAPISYGEADVVVGVRPLGESRDLSTIRRGGNRFGSWLFGRILKVPITDATSGYRAFSREALMRLTVISDCTYTLETLIRAARLHLAVHEVVVPVLPRKNGESRMTRSVVRYVGLAGGQAFRTVLHANPLSVFGRAALAMFAASVGLTIWFLVGYQSGGMHLPSLLAALFTLALSIGLFLCGLIADGINTNHRLLEEVLFHLRRIEHEAPQTHRGVAGVRRESLLERARAQRALGGEAVLALPRKLVIAAVYPHAAGAAHFNAAMVKAMSAKSAVELLGWRRMYPPLLYRGPSLDTSAPPDSYPTPSFTLDWHDPRTWRRALRRAEEFEAEALVLPWLHPVMSVPYRFLLKHAPKATARVVICHNVLPHERHSGVAWLTRAVLRHADLLVVHAPHQQQELAELDLGSIPVVDAFHPRFVASDLARRPTAEEVAAERARWGDPDLLLVSFGSVRRYKGIDLAVDALALVDPDLDVRLVVAGHFWSPVSVLRARAERLGVERKVEFQVGFVSNNDAALLFTAADAALLPYRSASQSGVVQLSFAFGCPVIATRVGGLPASIEDGRDGLLCEPGNPVALARAIERMAREHETLAAGVRSQHEASSFDRYTEILDGALVGVRP